MSMHRVNIKYTHSPYNDKERTHRHGNEDRDVAEKVCNQGRHVVIETDVIGEVEAQCTPNEHKLAGKYNQFLNLLLILHALSVVTYIFSNNFKAVWEVLANIWSNL